MSETDVTEVDVTAPALRTALEAILFVIDEPVDEVVLAQVVERPREEVAQTLHRLAGEYDDEGRGFELRQVAGGWRIYTRSDCAAYVERFVRDGRHTRLSQAALETLAVIAYRQPVTRSRIAAVRAVNVDAVMRTLVARGLIEEAGAEPDTGAIRYVTTDSFLEHLGMASLAELPTLSDQLPDSSVIDDDVSLG